MVEDDIDLIEIIRQDTLLNINYRGGRMVHVDYHNQICSTLLSEIDRLRAGVDNSIAHPVWAKDIGDVVRAEREECINCIKKAHTQCVLSRPYSDELAFKAVGLIEARGHK